MKMAVMGGKEVSGIHSFMPQMTTELSPDHLDTTHTWCRGMKNKPKMAGGRPGKTFRAKVKTGDKNGEVIKIQVTFKY